MSTSDVPSLIFVNPDEIVTTYRVCLWASPGQGKSVIACSAPGPLLVLSADRPTAYQFARAYWTGPRHREIREIRYVDVNTLRGVLAYLREEEGQPPGGREIKTVIVDPLSNIYDQLVQTAPRRDDGDVDYQAVNLSVMAFLRQLRPLDVNVVLIAHEKLNDGKKGDNKLYPALGGPSLVNKALGEMDICSHLERQTRTIEVGGRMVEQARYVGQLQPADGIVCKESTGTDLGPFRIADLSRWFALANAAYDQGMPWAEPQEGGWADVLAGDAEAPADNAPVAFEGSPAEPTPTPEPATATLGDLDAATLIALAEILRTDDGLDALRKEADGLMCEVNCEVDQRLRELTQAGGDELKLRALIAGVQGEKKKRVLATAAGPAPDQTTLTIGAAA
jgi:hypothetical protein